MYICNKNYSSPELFNSAIAAYIISAANELGLIEELNNHSYIDICEFSRDRCLHQSSFQAIINVLCCFNICKRSNNNARLEKGTAFEDIYRNQGFFLWLTRGYGELMQNLASVTANPNEIPNITPRNGKYIALASRQQGEIMVDKYFENALLDFPFNNVVDLGCGSGERLRKLAKNNPDLRGIGIDISLKAVEFARSIVFEEALHDRVTILHADMRKLQKQECFLEVDTIFSFFSGHDMWPKDNCINILEKMRQIFPNAKRFLLCDTYRSNISEEQNLPIFTLGFETIHATLGEYIPSLEEWINLFAESCWQCVHIYDVEAPFSSIFDLRPR